MAVYRRLWAILQNIDITMGFSAASWYSIEWYLGYMCEDHPTFLVVYLGYIPPTPDGSRTHPNGAWPPWTHFSERNLFLFSYDYMLYGCTMGEYYTHE